MLDGLMARIESEGPLPFEDFMRAALYGPGGFFAGESLRSQESGDFLTSPEISPMFGEALAVLVEAEAARLGISRPDLVEGGAGSGSLLRPLLDSLGSVGGVWATEVSPPAAARLAERVPEARVVGSLAEIPSGLEGVIIANELLDNLPAALAIRRAGKWAEQRVGIAAGSLALVEVPARREIAAWADAYGGPVTEGGRVEVQIEAGAWVRAALELLRVGCLVAIDYGDTAEGLRPRRAEGTLRTYRAHHLGPDPLLDPGATDITMDVNFTAAGAAARSAGATVELIRQEEALTSWGLRERVRELRHTELRLAREGKVAERLQARSRVTEGETLLHPRGLGDFRVLIARI